MNHRLCVLVGLLTLAACGSSSTPTGQDLCNKAGTVSSNIVQKLAACNLGSIDTGIPTGQACTSQLASCNSNDQGILNAVLDCLNGLPTLTASTCSTGLAAFETQGDQCVSSRVTTLSAACQSATQFGSSSSNGGSTDVSGGSCLLTGGTQCLEFPGQTSSTIQGIACPAASATYSSSPCATTNRVGRCTAVQQGVDVIVSFYNVTASTAQSQCTQLSGTWTAG